MPIPWLDSDANAAFPPLASALSTPNGLLAAGGDLSVPRLINAYRQGIFPWYSQGDPILWWSPQPRLVFDTHKLHLSSRFRRSLRQLPWTVRANADFAAVLDACAHTPRKGQIDTWITHEMRSAYIALHQAGFAHSIEVRDADDKLLGGLYGVSVGRMFFGESMVSLQSGASKLAIAALCLRLHQWGWPLLDAQVQSPHLLTLGARTMQREQFAHALATLTTPACPQPAFAAQFAVLTAQQVALGAEASVKKRKKHANNL